MPLKTPYGDALRQQQNEQEKFRKTTSNMTPQHLQKEAIPHRRKLARKHRGENSYFQDKE